MWRRREAPVRDHPLRSLALFRTALLWGSYLPGAKLPPHISPFVDYTKQQYVPEQVKWLRRQQRIARGLADADEADEVEEEEETPSAEAPSAMERKGEPAEEGEGEAEEKSEPEKEEAEEEEGEESEGDGEEEDEPKVVIEGSDDERSDDDDELGEESSGEEDADKGKAARTRSGDESQGDDSEDEVGCWCACPVMLLCLPGGVPISSPFLHPYSSSLPRLFPSPPPSSSSE